MTTVETDLPLVPTVDIGPYLKDPSSAESQSIISTIHRACLTTGFFQVTGHGISRKLQTDAIAGAKAFFSLPLDEKKKLDTKTTLGHRGYDVMGVQSYSADALPDLKESFYMAHDVPAKDPRVVAGRFFMGPNVWPDASVLPHSAFKARAEAYYDANYRLMTTLLELMTRSLPYGPGIFDRFVSDGPVAPMRMLHYPPQSSTDERQAGASAHTDFGALTLLLQDEHPGLQVLDPKTNQWVIVPPVEGAYVVNIGDMLAMWTNNLYKSRVHRVVNRCGEDRYSIAFYMDGNLDCPLDPMDGSAPKNGKSITVEGHMLAKMSASYGKSEDSKVYSSKL